MQSPNPRKYIVRRVEQVRSLAGPTAHQIVAVLERTGPSSVKEMAAQMGVPADSLYYHIRRLQQAGLLSVCHERPTARRPEAVYQLPGSELVFDPANRSARFLKALAGLQRSLMAMATRIYERAVLSPTAVRAGPTRNLCVIQQNARLAAKDLKELNQRLESIATFLAEHDDPSAGGFISLTVSLSPLVRD